MRNTLISIAVFIVLVVACIDAANIKREFLKKNEKIVNSKPQDVKYVHMRNNGFLKVSDVSPNDDWIARGWIILGDFNSTGYKCFHLTWLPSFSENNKFIIKKKLVYTRNRDQSRLQRYNTSVWSRLFRRRFDSR